MQIWVENAALRKYILRFGVNFRSLHGRNVKTFPNLGLKKWIIVFLTFSTLRFKNGLMCWQIFLGIGQRCALAASLGVRVRIIRRRFFLLLLINWNTLFQPGKISGICNMGILLTPYPLIVISTEKTFLVHQCYILIKTIKPLWLEWLVRKRTLTTQFSSRAPHFLFVVRSFRNNCLPFLFLRK